MIEISGLGRGRSGGREMQVGMQIHGDILRKASIKFHLEMFLQSNLAGGARRVNVDARNWGLRERC